MNIVWLFLLWTMILYWIHRCGHKIKFINKYHQDHHRYIRYHPNVGWSWKNLFLYNDTKNSTIDLWITEVIPTIIFSYVTGHWVFFAFYYFWAAFVQESIEHNRKFSLYPLTSGKWHLVHHKNQNMNFGLFFPLWDIIFGTNKMYAD